MACCLHMRLLCSAPNQACCSNLSVVLSFPRVVMSAAADRWRSGFTNEGARVGVQAGQYNAYGDTNVQYHITQSGASICICRRKDGHANLCAKSRASSRLHGALPTRRPLCLPQRACEDRGTMRSVCRSCGTCRLGRRRVIPNKEYS